MSFLCSGGAWPWGSLFARGGSAHPLDLGSNLSLIKTQKYSDNADRQQGVTITTRNEQRMASDLPSQGEWLRCLELFLELDQHEVSSTNLSQWEFTFPVQRDDVKPSTYFWIEINKPILKPSLCLADLVKSVDKAG
ncbi:hypothetical protein Q9966_016280 [Columba livia]|nr:hypothetical protein Q9966_016280 [Columba livia]